jgi:4-hydroxybenzoate polyprenyltransferase
MLTLIKDIKDTDADYNAGLNTLPVAIGKKRTIRVIFTLGLIAVALLLYYTNAYLKNLLWLLGFGLVFILGPVIYLLINILSTKTQKEFTTLEVVLKLVLFFTALSLAVMTFNIKYIQ